MQRTLLTVPISSGPPPLAEVPFVHYLPFFYGFELILLHQNKTKFMKFFGCVSCFSPEPPITFSLVSVCVLQYDYDKRKFFGSIDNKENTSKFEHSIFENVYCVNVMKARSHVRKPSAADDLVWNNLKKYLNCPWFIRMVNFLLFFFNFPNWLRLLKVFFEVYRPELSLLFNFHTSLINRSFLQISLHLS